VCKAEEIRLEKVLMQEKAKVKTIDLAVQDRQTVVAALDASLGEAGVVFVRMTAAQQAAKTRALNAAKAFFALPQVEKLAVQAPQGAGNACLRGFVPYGSQLQRRYIHLLEC
jgi:isopenicillin N synthase-like dioxygenase